MIFRKKKLPTVYVTPPPRQSRQLGGAYLLIREKLRAHGLELEGCYLDKVPNDAALVIVNNIWAEVPGRLEQIRALDRKIPKERRLLILAEPAVVDPSNHQKDKHELFGRIVTLYDDLVDNEKFFLYICPFRRIEPLEYSVPFDDRKLLTMVVGNKSSSHPDELYTTRRRAIEYFEKNAPGDFEFYGTNWEWMGYHSYKGAPADELPVINKYRFGLCYENTQNVYGYCTNKPIQFLVSRCVPVYLGSTNWDQYIPRSCMIDRRDFSDLIELERFLRAMSREEHQRYLNYGQQFLESERARPYSIGGFADNLAHHILEMTSIQRVSR